jgi:hypothetical protein
MEGGALAVSIRTRIPGRALGGHGSHITSHRCLRPYSDRHGHLRWKVFVVFVGTFLSGLFLFKNRIDLRFFDVPCYSRRGSLEMCNRDLPSAYKNRLNSVGSAAKAKSCVRSECMRVERACHNSNSLFFLFLVRSTASRILFTERETAQSINSCDDQSEKNTRS